MCLKSQFFSSGEKPVGFPIDVYIEYNRRYILKQYQLVSNKTGNLGFGEAWCMSFLLHISRIMHQAEVLHCNQVGKMNSLWSALIHDKNLIRRWWSFDQLPRPVSLCCFLHLLPLRWEGSFVWSWCCGHSLVNTTHCGFAGYRPGLVTTVCVCVCVLG